MLSQIFMGTTHQSKSINFLSTGFSTEPSVNADSKLASYVASIAIKILYHCELSSAQMLDLRQRLTKYVKSVMQKTHISTSAVMLSLLYCNRLSLKVGTQEELFKTWTMTLVLADCFLHDNSFSTRSWSKVTGLTKAQVSLMKRQMLVALAFNLHVGEFEYSQFLEVLETNLQTKAIPTMARQTIQKTRVNFKAPLPSYIF